MALEGTYMQQRSVPRRVEDMDPMELWYWELEAKFWALEARRPGSRYRRLVASPWRKILSPIFPEE
jgi:hypothetical protein